MTLSMRRSPVPLTPYGGRPSRRRSILYSLVGWISIVLLFAGCATNPARVDDARVDATRATPSTERPDRLEDRNSAYPPFYRIGGGDGATLLLMGTIHLGPEEGWNFSPSVTRGLARADRFVMETDLRQATEEAVSNLVANLVIMEHPNTLFDVISPETAKLLEEKDGELALHGMPRRARRIMKPWFIAIGLVESISSESGFNTASAAETALMEALGDRPLLGLETFEEQMRMLDGLSPEIQDLMLRDTLLRLDQAVEETQALVLAWRTGDLVGLEASAREGTDALPELEAFYEILLDQRNRRWLPTLQTFLDDPRHAGETVFVGVGALHLVGPNGLVSLLRRAGYQVELVDQPRN